MTSGRFEALGRIVTADPAGTEWAAADWIVSVEGRPSHTLRFRSASARLEVPEGDGVELDLAEAELVGLPQSSVTGRWEELADELMRRCSDGFRPEADVVSVVRRGIRRGKRVAVRGAAQRTGDPVSYRDGAARRVRVEELAPAAPGEMFEHAWASEARIRGVADAAWLLTVAMVAALAAWALGTGWVEGSRGSVGLGCAWGAFAGTLTWRLAPRWWGHRHLAGDRPSFRWLPEPRAIEREGGRELHGQSATSPDVSVTLLFVFLGALPGVAALMAATEARGVAPFGLVPAVLTSAIASLALFLEDWRATRPARRFARAIVAAGSGPAGAAEGRSSTEIERCVTAETVSVAAVRGQSTSVHAVESWRAPAGIEIAGATISTDGLTWAHARQTRYRRGSVEGLREVAPAGSSAIAVWTDAPLLFTASHAPKRALAVRLWLQRAGLVPLAISMVMAAAYLGLGA